MRYTDKTPIKEIKGVRPEPKESVWVVGQSFEAVSFNISYWLKDDIHAIDALYDDKCFHSILKHALKSALRKIIKSK